MSLIPLIRILAVVVGIVGLSCLFPLFVALGLGEREVVPAFLTPVVTGVVATLFVFLARDKRQSSIGVKTAFFCVAFSWIVACLIGSVPLIVSGAAPSYIDAFFESVSGFTTTGATVISGLDNLPRSINLWRCQTHWLGGMGIVVLTVAITPLLGVGGFYLVKAETTGPEKGRLTPKIANTAKALWLIYMFLTAIEAILLRIFGMDWIDAVSHSFSTLGTGGFSSRDSSIGGFNSPAVEWICSIFMLLAAINFSLYFHLISKRFRQVYENSELRAFFMIITCSVLLIVFLGRSGGDIIPLRTALFQVASVISTTGFTTADYTKWSLVAPSVIFSLFLIGGCSGSTGGGVKIIRWVILRRTLRNEALRLLHPRGVFSLHLDSKPMSPQMVVTVAAFVFLYFALVIITTFAGALTGLNLETSLTGALSMVGNIGPAFGDLGPSANCGWINPYLKLWYCFAMLAGRLELYTLMIFLSRSYWKRW